MYMYIIHVDAMHMYIHYNISASIVQAGSSSPVSSISGFSTNSHLDEGGEEGGTGGGGGGGGKEDRTPRNDPFAGMIGASSSTSQTATDPFAAFSVPGSDHFTSTGITMRVARTHTCMKDTQTLTHILRPKQHTTQQHTLYLYW